MKTETELLRRNQICMAIVITGLAISGITAFPIQVELEWLTAHSNGMNAGMRNWLSTVLHALQQVDATYPFLNYGTDWLAFAHVMLAILFVGPLRDPVKNVWIIQFGIIACVLILPLAFIAGTVRGIPLFWQLIDCSFGVIAIIPLYISYSVVKQLTNIAHPYHDIQYVAA